MTRFRLALALGAILVAGSAEAAPSPDQLRDAKAHFAAGRSALDGKRYDDAIREFETAYAIAPIPELLFNSAQAWRLKGDKRKALSYYERYLEMAPNGPVAEDARSNVTVLRLEIQLDDEQAARRKAVEDAEAARKAAEEASRRAAPPNVVAPPDSAQIRSEMAKTAAEVAATIAAQQERERQEALDRDRARQGRIDEANNHGRSLRTVGGVALGLGLAGVVASAGFLIDAIVQTSSAKLDNEFMTGQTYQWSTTRDDAIARIHDDQTAMYALWGVGGGLVAVGAVLVGIGQHQRNAAVESAQHEASSRLEVAPSVARGSAGLSVRVGF